MTTAHYDIVVIGSGPAGQKAAIQGAKAGKRVALIEQEFEVGGACVYRGTIPSKTLRESALQMSRFQRTAEVFEFKLRDDVKVASLMSRLDHVVKTHGRLMNDQLTRNGIERFHGRARFATDREVQITTVEGTSLRLRGEVIVIATGSRPRIPESIPVDHEHILDSDSILSLVYLPKSLTVLGGGVIASEYASIFAILGVQVTMIDTADRPLRFLDQELTDEFFAAFYKSGGRYVGGQQIEEVAWDGCSRVVTRLKSGETVLSEKLLVALGRVANVESLDVQAAGLDLTSRGLIPVNHQCQTPVPHIYAVGDVIGPPALASCAMEQGRRAVRHALGLDPGLDPEHIPMGIYTVPEISSVGLSEQEAVGRYGGALVGRAHFHEIARSQISGMTNGVLKLVADPTTERILGVQIVGEGATELIHIGQMALLNRLHVESFVDTIFNFPTLAEAYRVAALDLLQRRPSRSSVISRDGL
ncbi:MAG: Si-specific NAD(P)(+) transhydrogenase [Nitrospirae bacterium]|nr:MAG: Si-specific NAD(P)(+) transhydrogenase [Nitrospirota bacterium]